MTLFRGEATPALERFHPFVSRRFVDSLGTFESRRAGIARGLARRLEQARLPRILRAGTGGRLAGQYPPAKARDARKSEE